MAAEVAIDDGQIRASSSTGSPRSRPEGSQVRLSVLNGSPRGRADDGMVRSPSSIASPPSSAEGSLVRFSSTCSPHGRADDCMVRTSSRGSLRGRRTLTTFELGERERRTIVPKLPDKTKKHLPVERAYVKVARSIVDSKWFVLFVSLLTVYALVGDDSRLLFTEAPADVAFNAVTIAALIVFTFEIILSCIGKEDYFLGFFFLLDCVSTLTLILDLSWIGDKIQGDDEEVSDARAGRTARLGARVGSRVLRLMRMVKLYKALYDARHRRLSRASAKKSQTEKAWDDEELDELDALNRANKAAAVNRDQGSRVGKKLSELTIRRVILLVLMMMFVLPLLKPPDVMLPTSALYGAALVAQAYDRMMNYSDVSGYSDIVPALDSEQLRSRYEKTLLRYIYFHHWYTGRQDTCPATNKECANSELAHVFWVGMAGTSQDRLLESVAQARVRRSTLSAWQMEATNDINLFTYGPMPAKVDIILRSRWDMSCPNSKGLALLGFSLIKETVSPDEYPNVQVSHAIRCPENLRRIERVAYSPQFQRRSVISQQRWLFYFDKRPLVRREAVYNLAISFFVCFSLCVASWVFTQDANQLVLEPLENMMRKVETIRESPMKAIRMGDDDCKAEEVARQLAEKKEREMYGQWLKVLRNALPCTAPTETPMETVILERTIVKLGSLLALGFGEAGSKVVAHNICGQSTMIDHEVLGQPVDCIIVCTRIGDFSTVTEVLQGNVMTFVNQIAEIVHGVINEFHGAVNSYNGDSFLAIWRVSDVGDEWAAKLADMSVIAMVKILGAIHRSPRLAAYRNHPGLQIRLQGDLRCRVNVTSGMHFGWAIEGALGTEFKIDASYVSPNVSIAEAMERMCTTYGVNLILSQCVVQELTAGVVPNCRPIDRVRLEGWTFEMEIFVIDLDVSVLTVDNFELGMQWGTRARFRARQFLEQEKKEKTMERFTTHQCFVEDKDIAMMRQTYTEEFFEVFKMGYQNYLEGEWEVAANMFRKTSDMLSVRDGPSLALLKYMHEQGQIDNLACRDIDHAELQDELQPDLQSNRGPGARGSHIAVRQRHLHVIKSCL